jgi:hypothetical protein
VFDNEHSLHLWKRHPCTSTVEKQLTDWREQVTTWRDLCGLFYSHSDIVCLLIQLNCTELQPWIDILIWIAWLFDYPVPEILNSTCATAHCVIDEAWTESIQRKVHLNGKYTLTKSTLERKVHLNGKYTWTKFWTENILVLVYSYAHRPDDGGSKDLWNVGKLLPDYTVLQPRRQQSSVYSCVVIWSSSFVDALLWTP